MFRDTIFYSICVTHAGTLQTWLHIIDNDRFRLLQSWNQYSWDQWKKNPQNLNLPHSARADVVSVLCLRFKSSLHLQTAHSWYCVLTFNPSVQSSETMPNIWWSMQFIYCPIINPKNTLKTPQIMTMVNLTKWLTFMAFTFLYKYLFPF